MFAVLDCLHRHDPRLVAWAALICIVTVSAGLTAYGSALAKGGVQRRLWLAIVALMVGAGVWATHFMAMLAFQREMTIGFGLNLTLLSGVLAVIGLAAGFAVCARYGGLRGRAAGGAGIGLAIGLMHFTGVAAMQLPADIAWDLPLVVLSLLIGVSAASVAMVTAGDMTSPLRAVGAGALLVLAVCGLHFVAMSAAILTPDPLRIPDPDLFSRDQLAVGVGLLAVLALAGGAGIMTLDRFAVASALASLRSALNQAPEAIAFFDRTERLVFWNELYAGMLEVLDLKAVKGLPLKVILAEVAPDPEQRAKLLTDLPTALLPDGRWVQPSIAATADGGMALVLTDITALLALTQRESDARKQAEAASQAKSDFLANISHEIRTPLNAILGMVQILSRDAVTPDQVEGLGIVADAGRALLSVVDSVLDISRIETGAFRLVHGPFDLAEALERAVAGPRAECVRRGVRFALDLAPDVAGGWTGDGARLAQVVRNLATNAARFTTAGQVRVEVRRDAAGRVAVAVTDTGCGIPEDQAAAVFETFTQVDSSASRSVGGVGLGLPIARSLVALMGGELTVSSQVGQGTAFRFALPLERALASAAGPVPVPAAAPAPVPAPGDEDDRPLRILAAEDNLANRRVLAALLEPFGVELTLVEDGQAAIDACAPGAFDLVLMDIQMPIKTGVEATREIRERERADHRARLPIVAVTANVMTHQLDEYADAGIDGWVSKPIDAGALITAIQTAMSAGAARERIAA